MRSTMHVRKTTLQKIEKMYIKYETRGKKCLCNAVLKNKALKIISR